MTTEQSRKTDEQQQDAGEFEAWEVAAREEGIFDRLAESDENYFVDWVDTTMLEKLVMVMDELRFVVKHPNGFLGCFYGGFCNICLIAIGEALIELGVQEGFSDEGSRDTRWHRVVVPKAWLRSDSDKTALARRIYDDAEWKCVGEVHYRTTAEEYEAELEEDLEPETDDLDQWHKVRSMRPGLVTNEVTAHE